MRLQASTTFFLVLTMGVALLHESSPLAVTNLSAPSTNASKAPATSPELQANVVNAVRTAPLMFVENTGQFDPQVRFEVRGQQGTVHLTGDGLWYTLLEPERAAYGDGEESKTLDEVFDNEHQVRRGVNLKVSFVGANPAAEIIGFERLETTVSYFTGNDPEKSHTNVPVWAGVRYTDLYPGIDLEVTSKNGRLVERIVARSGAPLNAVRLRVEGADMLALNGDMLRVATTAGDFTLPLLTLEGALPGRQPSTLNLAGGTSDVVSPFVSAGLSPDHSVEADNPSDLVYATYLGGSEHDCGVGAEPYAAIAVDASGAAYVTGHAVSADFPTTPGAFDTSHPGYNYAAFVAKISPDGSHLVYSTFLDGWTNDFGRAIDVDAWGAAYVTGSTESSDFPTTPGAFRGHSGSSDAFITKLAADGSSLVYSTCLGGAYGDNGYSIAVDPAGMAYVAGDTYLDGFPTTPGAFDAGYNGMYDAFVTKLNTDGSSLVYSTTLGGSSHETARAIALDASGAAYVAGSTISSDFPTTPGAFDAGYNGMYDAFVTKLNTDGSSLVYSTLLGGSSDDAGQAIAVDASFAAYVTGGTLSGGFPTTPGTFSTTYNAGESDAFVTKVNPDGSSLVYSTFLGGKDQDRGYAIAVGGSGTVYLTGYTVYWNDGMSGPYFPTTAGAFDTSLNGTGWAIDAFVTRMNPQGSDLVYSTLLGGTSADYGGGIALDTSGAAYVIGSTQSGDFPTTPGAIQGGNHGGYDAFVAKLLMGPMEPVVRVEDEGGNALSGAKVYCNGALAGTTGPAGTLTIAALGEGDQLAATYLVDEARSLKGSHSQGGTQDWAYRVYLTSVAIDNDGNPQLHRFDPLNTMQVLTVTKRSALIGFNIVASVEWDASPAYLDGLRRGFESASASLYDATDGQALFERVTIYDNGQQWGQADYQVTANNRVVPFANEITVIPEPQYLANSMHFGRCWERRVGVSNSWTDSDAYRTLVHEFGHYALGLYDHYFYYSDVGKRDASCTSTAITSNSTPAINATVMYFQYNATEFSMRGVSGLWSPICEQTEQFDKNNGESDWETIARHYTDSATPPRWELVTPGARGEVAEGPSSIPVASWSTATIGNDAKTGTCSANPDFLAQYPGGAPAKEAEVWLASSDDMEIYQGKTGDSGAITVLGARNGDKVTVASSRGDWRTEWTVACATELGDVASSTAVTTVILEPAPFRLDVAVTPAGGPNQAAIRLKASTLLNGSPQVEVFQGGAAAPIAVAMVYDPATDTYTGALTLDPALPPRGSVEANAIDTHGHSLQTFTTFNLSDVTASQDATIYGPDGLVELYLPEGTLLADGCLSIAPDSSAGETPEELVTLSGPYSIHGDEGTALTGNAPLTMGYGDTDALVATAQIYRWDASEGTWVALNSTVGRDGNWVSAPIDALGTYALMAHRQHVVNLPLVLKNH